MPAAAPQPAAAADAGIPNKAFTLEDAIAQALRKNFDLQIQGYTVENAKDQLAIQQAAFDPTINASVTRSLQQNASNNSTLEGEQRDPTRTNSVNGTLSVTERILPTNGNLTLSTNLARGDTNQSQVRINPAFNNGVTARLVQPLLADAGRRAATAGIDRAKLQVNIASIAYKSRVLAVISDTENSYYNLVAARETLRIRQFSLEYNQRFLEENSARRQTGVATDLDVLSAEVGLARARQQLVQAQQSVRDAEDRLLNLINDPSFEARVGPVAFDDYKGGIPNFSESYKRAREYYPETLSAEEQMKQLRIDLDTARRNQLPDLNLIAQLGYVARTNPDGYIDVIESLPREPGNNWQLGLNYSMPWGRHADKARFRIAQTQLNSQKLRLDQLEQALLVNVRSAVRAVETQLVAVEIASKGSELALRQYEQQSARFQAGLSTSRLVLQFQDDLEDARFLELSARLALRRAAAELGRLEGTSIQRFRVQLPQ
ncbi:MAG: TolC family protein [Verrucomicrobiota bacterium]